MYKPVGWAFTRRNYCLILSSVILLITGFILMTGESNSGIDSFNTDIYSFRRITLAPIILVAGYALMIYAIMSVSGNPKENKHG